MKEASGEANLTVIAIILIGVIAAIVTPLIANMMDTTKRQGCCASAGGEWANNTCSGSYMDQATYTACIGEVQGR